MGMRLFLLACRRTGFACLQTLLAQQRHKVVGVCSADYNTLIDDGLGCRDYEQLCLEHGVPFFCRDEIHDPAFLAEVALLGAELGLSLGWRRLVRAPMLAAMPKGFVNFHTSDLPRYRGFASTSWAILNGDGQMAITAHEMLDGVADEGRVYLKRHIPITRRTTIASLFAQVEEQLPDMLLQLLDGIEDGSLLPQAQDESELLLSFPRLPTDGWIDWSLAATEIDRLVRSVTRPYPGAFTCLGLRKVAVWRGHVLPDPPPFVGVHGHIAGYEDDGAVRVLTGEGIYVVQEVEIDDSGVALAPASVVSGMRQRFGMSQGQLFELLQGSLGR